MTQTPNDKDMQRQLEDARLSLKDAPEESLRQQAEVERLKGNNFMQAQKYIEALTCYQKSTQIYEEVSTYSNMALVNLKLNNHKQVVDDANNALRLDQSNVKAYFRRGSAYLKLGENQKALEDFQTILEKGPSADEITVKNLIEYAKLGIESKEQDQKA